MKTQYQVIVREPIIPNLNPALINFDARGKVVMVAIVDPILYGKKARDFMKKKGVRLIRRRFRKSDREEIKKFLKL